MTTLDLQNAYEQAEAKAQKLMADKDTDLQKVRDKYGPKLKAANDDAAAKQKLWHDALAADALLDRPDGQAIADALGLELPSQ